MGELSEAYEDVEARLKPLLEKCPELKGKFILSCNTNGAGTNVLYAERISEPISIHVKEPGELIYRFTPARFEDVKKCLHKAGVVGNYLLTKIRGYSPRNGEENLKEVATKLPTKKPFKEIADLVQAHVLLLKERK